MTELNHRAYVRHTVLAQLASSSPRVSTMQGRTTAERSETAFLIAMFVAMLAIVPVLLGYTSLSTSQPISPPTPATAFEQRPSPGLQKVTVSYGLAVLTSTLPLVTTGCAIAYSIAMLALQPFISVATILLAVFSPFIVVLQATASLFIFVPAHFAMDLGRLVHPIYMFCSVACIVGIGLGFGAKTVGHLVYGTLRPPVQSPRQQKVRYIPAQPQRHES